MTDEDDPATPAPLGPGSLTWRYFGDTRMLLVGPRAAVLQNMLPALGQGACPPRRRSRPARGARCRRR